MSSRRVQGIARHYGIDVYYNESDTEIADRLAVRIQQLTAALAEMRAPAPDPDSMWDCNLCMALLPCPKHDDKEASDG